MHRFFRQFEKQIEYGPNLSLFFEVKITAIQINGFGPENVTIKLAGFARAEHPKRDTEFNGEF